MSENRLSPLLKGVAPKYTDQLSLEDLKAVQAGDEDGLSTEGMRLLVAGKQDLGLGEYTDIGTSLAGALTGAALGSAFGPVGTVAGGVLGGAAGAFGGEVGEDIVAGRDINAGFSEGGAGREALISAGFDTATLGAGKIVRGLIPLFKKAQPVAKLSDELKPALEIADAAKGSGASLVQTQEEFLKAGTSLSPMAAESAGFLTTTMHELGEIGFISRGIYDADQQARKDVVIDLFRRYTDRAEKLAKDNLGARMWGLITTGQKAAQEIYGEGLSEIGSRAGLRWFSAAPVGKSVDDFLALKTIRRRDPATGTITKLSSLSPEARKIGKELNQALGGNGPTGQFQIRGLLDIEKRLNKSIQDYMPTGGLKNASVARELSQMHTALRKGVLETIRKTDPAIARRYARLQKTYTNIQDALFSDINSSLVKAADKDQFHQLGNLLLTQQEPHKIKAFMRSVDTAHAVEGAAARLRGESYDVAARSREAKEIIRGSYANELTGGLSDATVFNKGFLNKVFAPEQQETMQAVFGKEWPAFKKILNAVNDQTTKKSNGIFSLAFRSQELSRGVGGLAQAGMGIASLTGLGPTVAGFGAAALVFGSPVILYKLATRPSTMNRILALDNKIKLMMNKADPQVQEVFAAGVSKIINSLPSEDRDYIQGEMDRLGIVAPEQPPQ
jgi:hypothetical protein